MEASDQLHARDALLRGKSPRYPEDMRLGEPQRLSGCCGVEKNLLPCRQPNSCRPARSPSLYRLSYPGSFEILVIGLNSPNTGKDDNDDDDNSPSHFTVAF
jgi:hypothetical protein